jgi:hypothetical protein
MPDKEAFCVMLQVETSDRRLTLEAIAEAVKTAGGMSRMRHAILQHLPNDVTRLIAVLPPKHAALLMMLHESVGSDIAEMARAAGIPVGNTDFVRPPADYVPPTRD